MAKKSKYTKEERKAMIDGLEKAARLLKRHEWITDAEVMLEDGSKCDVATLGEQKPYGFCAIGALEYAGAPVQQVRELLTDVMDRMYVSRSKVFRDQIAQETYPGFRLADNTPGLDIVDFNDGNARSRRDVLHVFRTAQRLLRSRTI